MAAPDDDDAPPSVPTAGVPAEPRVQPKNRLRLSLVWIVPLVAVIAGVILGARTWLGTGPTITITFRTAEGLDPGRTEVRFETLSGTLAVKADGERLVMDFPRWTLEPLDSVPKELARALRAAPKQVLAVKEGGNFFAVFANEFVPEGKPPREWAERMYDVRRWTEMPRGGHFAALEEPDLLARDIAAFFAGLT